MAASPEPVRFELDRGAMTLRGRELGAGPPAILCHGLTATRDHVLHGSKLLARRGHRLITYDARGHGESDPAPPGGGYSYRELAGDLAAVSGARAGDSPMTLIGHSMGAHTIVAHALARPGGLSALILIGPASIGTPVPADEIARWDRLAEGMEEGGVEGFISAFEGRLPDEWRDTVLRFTRDRLSQHLHPEAVAQALREVPRDVPFDGLGELEAIDLPALVVASNDDADPSHPYAVAAEWARRLPRGRLTSEAAGESPLAWQGGRLSREIAAFLDSL